MPRWSKTIAGTAPDGSRFSAIVCGRTKHEPCSTPGCVSHAGILCDYSVTREGVVGTCDRRCCQLHSKRVGKNRDYCLPHARVALTLGEGNA